MGHPPPGNTIQNGSARYVYDAENRLISAGGMSYIYDGDGSRVEKCTAGLSAGTCSANPTGTLYWHDTAGKVIDESDLAGSISEEYYHFLGQVAARVDRPSGTVHYYIPDHLGSARIIATPNSSTTVTVAESDYYPYGGEIPISGSDPNHYKFTGKERDAESGLDMFGARYYGNSLGRFMTPDWSDAPDAVPYADLSDPQSLNLYTYVRNNPTTITDPEGHCWGWIQWACNGFQRVYYGAFTDYGFKNRAQVVDIQEQQRKWLIEHNVKNVDQNGNPVSVDWSKAKGGDVHNSYNDIQNYITSLALKPINLPAWKDVAIDMDHMLSGHTPGGSRVSPGSGKDLFPADWSEEQIERAVREAYRNSKKISSIQTTGRVLLQGEGGGRTIQMWLNTATKTIESAWPK